MAKKSKSKNAPDGKDLFDKGAVELGRKMKAARQLTRPYLSLASMADEIEVSDDTLGRIESGERAPSVFELNTYCQKLKDRQVPEKVISDILHFGHPVSEEKPRMMVTSEASEDDTGLSSHENTRSDIWDYPKLGEQFFGAKIKKSGLRVVGETVLLIEQSGSNKFRSLKVSSIVEPKVELSGEVTSSRLGDYVKSCTHFYSDPVIQYLLERTGRKHAGSGVDFADEKLGLHSLILPTQVRREFEVSIVRTSFWTEREFNRRIVLPDVEPELIDLARGTWDVILSPRVLEIEFEFPCTIYIEFVLITRDDKLLVLKKKQNVPNIPVWSCSVERGLRWNTSMNKGEFNLEEPLLECLEAELQLETTHVEDWWFTAVGLKAHLDSAVLGYVRLSLTKEQLSSLIGPQISSGESHYFSEFDFVRLDSAIAELQEKYGEQLHPSALARAELTARALNR
ncbi:XRE family transcriptional regulator [Bradyrhizobium guangzhouense]|uniref:XRE family transcriptional regulator n=1 Tax=Bradyrhizobium guangzhouense TaxID=1325095 RepID=A0ABY0E7G7_9BRAD|nr:helix-turn-helix transcriptional regulator [Bradyrhizobium guangzhouense]RXH12323.1 XRE family transcriptional regulator [Bradyrhizobium guangzhouense]